MSVKKEEPKIDAAPGQAKTSPAKVLYVKSKQANLYAQPGDYATVVGKLQQGEALTQLGLAFGMADSLYKVQTQKGTIGWVRMTDVASTPQSGKP